MKLIKGDKIPSSSDSENHVPSDGCVGEDSEGYPIYVVEKIINKKIALGKILYRVKWFNYPNSKNTWEPEENL